jgi:hypothetical protein
VTKKKGNSLNARRKADASLVLPKDLIKGQEMAFVGLLPTSDGLFYTVSGVVNLTKGIVLRCSYDKADLLELGLDRAETHLALQNTKG